DFLDSFEIFAGKIDIERADVLLEIFSAFGSRDWNDVVALREHPCQRELRRRAFLFASNFFDALYDIEIALKIVALKSRRRPPVVVLRNVFRLLNLTGQESTTKRRVRNKTDSELATNG